MTLLYRRFLIVILLIAAFAGIFANIILHTRTDRTRMHIMQSTPFTSPTYTPLSSPLPLNLFE